MQSTVQKIRCAIILVALVSLDPAAAETADNLTVVSATGIAGFDGWSELLQAPPISGDVEQRRHFESFREALASHSFDEAEILAKEMVEFVNKSALDDPLARCRVLHNLAVAQQFRGDHATAILNYHEAIDIVVAEDDMLSASLVLPLRGLALAYLDTGQPREALDAYDRALHISIVNDGPHSFGQIPILNSKMQVFLEHNDPKSALETLERVYLLYTRKFPRDSVELLPALYEQAQLYAQLNMSFEEREAWRHILQIRRKYYGENDLSLIEPNLKIARNLMGEMSRVHFRSGTTPTAEKHLHRALAIAEENPQADWTVRKKCLFELADYYTLAGMNARADRYYMYAWELLSMDDAYLANRAAELETPVPLAQHRPNRYANFEYNPDRDEIDPQDYLHGEMVFEFTVNDRGRTQDLQIVSAVPPDFVHMERRVRNSIKSFVYRPRYAAGAVTKTVGQQYRIEYLYLQSEYQASRDKGGKLSRP